MEYPGIVVEADKDEAQCCHRSRDCGVALAGMYLSVQRSNFRLLPPILVELITSDNSF